MLKTVLTAAASTALVATPIMAQTGPVDRLPVELEEAEGMEGGPGIIIAILAAAAIITGIIIAAGGDDDVDLPTSP